jgi:hypothetical protein
VDAAAGVRTIGVVDLHAVREDGKAEVDELWAKA